MGNARFDSTSYTSYRSSQGLTAQSTRAEEFTSSNMPQALDPKKILLRESCDSEANPNSNPIILGLDVTGSMGFVAEQIAKEGLPQLMERIYAEQTVEDPHLMFMGIGDVYCDRAPLQVSQFEAGAVPLIESLRSMWLESGGGGNNYESYDLPWYFAAHRTAIDSFNKRSKKGFIFTIGDELPPPGMGAAHIRKVFGDGQFPAAGSTEQLLKTVSEKYLVFHIIAEEGNYCRSGNAGRVREQWTSLLGPNVIFMRDHKNLAEIVTAALKIANGADIDLVVNDSQISKELKYAFANALKAE